MSGTLLRKKKAESEEEIVRRLLEHVERHDSVSQDGFAKQIGIAKGLANAYFNRCLRKGWIKLQQVPKQRFLYYLTPKGFAEKARLTARFLTHSYHFYREAREDIVALLADAHKHGKRRLAVLGAGELAEITAIVSEECPVELIGFVEPGSVRKRIAGHPVVATWTDLEDAEAAILATLKDARFVYEGFCTQHPTVPIFVPRQLHSLVWKKPK
jgi:hypothetical protein